MTLSKTEHENLEWLYSVLESKNYTEIFKIYAYKNIQRLEGNKSYGTRK